MPTVEFYKGLVHLKQGRFDEAIDRLQAAIGAGLGWRDWLHAHYFMADALWALGRFDAALACVDRALQSAYPDWFRGRMIRIRIGHFMGSVDEAKRELDGLWAEFGATHRASFPSVLACLGQPELARAILRENDAAWREGRLHLCSYSVGGRYYLGEHDETLRLARPRGRESRVVDAPHLALGALPPGDPEPFALPARNAPACGDRSERLAYEVGGDGGGRSVARAAEFRELSGRGTRGCPMIPR